MLQIEGVCSQREVYLSAKNAFSYIYCDFIPILGANVKRKF